MGIKALIASVLLAALAVLVISAQPFTHSGLPWAHHPPWVVGVPTNGPCLLPQPTNEFLTVITNSQNIVQLGGAGPTYVVSTPPTNGYLTNLNIVSGVVTYVETNSSATHDFFRYCTSNSPTCDICGPAYVNIVTSNQIACGGCFNLPPVDGGVITGNINLNTGVPFEQVCILYTNAACTAVTNCEISDANGNASFFVHMCPGSSNYCIVQQGVCTNICYFTHAVVSGAGAANGSYHLAGTLVTFEGGAWDFQMNLTNDADVSQSIQYDSLGLEIADGDNCSEVSHQGYVSIDVETPGLTTYYYTTFQVFNTNCTTIAPGSQITGWVPLCGPLPNPVVIIDGIQSFEQCTTNCP